MSTADTTTRDEIVAVVVGLVADLLGIEVTADTRFHEDLQLESVDLVTLAGMLTDVYGERVNLADHLAEMDLDQVIDLRIGDIVAYVESRVGGR